MNLYETGFHVDYCVNRISIFLDHSFYEKLHLKKSQRFDNHSTFQFDKNEKINEQGKIGFCFLKTNQFWMVKLKIPQS